MSQNNSGRCRAFGSKKRGVERGTGKKKLRETSTEERKSQVQQERWEHHKSRKTRRSHLIHFREGVQMQAATVAASSSSSQMESSHAVAETPTQQKSMAGKSRMDVEEEERDELRSSAVPNTRRRLTTTTPLEESKSDERAVAVTTQESSDGIREKAMRIASLDQLEASSGAGRRSSSGRS